MRVAGGMARESWLVVSSEVVQPLLRSVTTRFPPFSGVGNATADRPIGTLVATAMPRCPALFTAQ